MKNAGKLLIHATTLLLALHLGGVARAQNVSTGGLQNIASGSGTNNTADGDNSLFTDKNGDSNTGVGYQSLLTVP